MGATRALAELAARLSGEDIPEAARAAGRRMILDTLATGLAGWREAGISQVVEQMREWGGRPEASLLTHGDAMPAPNAAFANSCMVHALDFDDVHGDSGLHIMSSVLPAGLAIAEMRRRSGLDLLEAVIVGIEVAVRIGIPAYKGGMDRGFLPASVVGGFGATAAACRLMGMDADQTRNALGIYYAQTSGNRQALMDHSLTKRMQPAYSARSAVWSACLAARGVTGAHRALEGSEGFFRLYARMPAPEEADLVAPKDYFEVERVWVKPFSCCGSNHASMQAAIDLVKRENLRPEEIESVELRVSERVLWLVGAPFEVGSDPQVNAQFSLTYSVAAGLVHRQGGPKQFAPESVASDGAVHDMIRRIRLHEIEGSKGKFLHDVPSTVVITTRDGRTLSNTVQIIRGSAGDPMTYAEVADKFRICAEYAGQWPADRVEQIIAAVERLEDMPDVAELVRGQLTVPHQR